MSHFLTKLTDGIFVIECPQAISIDEVENLKSITKDCLDKDCRVFVFDFSKTQMIDPSGYQPFIIFRQALKGINKRFYSIGIKDSILKEIKSRGFDQVFNVVDSLMDARDMNGMKLRKKIDTEFINPFLVATKETLRVQANTEIQPKQPYRKEGETSYKVSIAGVISLISDHFSGSIALCFPASTFLNLYNLMFEEKNEVITPEIEDAAGELLNIIYGQAKATLNDVNGYQLKKAIPTVLTAEKLSIRQQGSGPVVILPFDTKVGPFHIEIETNDDC